MIPHGVIRHFITHRTLQWLLSFASLSRRQNLIGFVDKNMQYHFYYPDSKYRTTKKTSVTLHTTHRRGVKRYISGIFCKIVNVGGFSSIVPYNSSFRRFLFLFYEGIYIWIMQLTMIMVRGLENNMMFQYDVVLKRTKRNRPSIWSTLNLSTDNRPPPPKKMFMDYEECGRIYAETTEGNTVAYLVHCMFTQLLWTRGLQQWSNKTEELQSVSIIVNYLDTVD